MLLLLLLSANAIVSVRAGGDHFKLAGSSEHGWMRDDELHVTAEVVVDALESASLTVLRQEPYKAV